MNELDGKDGEVRTVPTAPPIIPQLPKQLMRQLQVTIPQELTLALSDLEFQVFTGEIQQVVNTWIKSKLLNLG